MTAENPFKSGEEVLNETWFRNWLGGYFEAAGTIGIYPKKPSRGRKYSPAIPLISVNDNSEERLKIVQRLLEGRIYKEKKVQSWKWQATGHKAANIIQSLDGVAPTRSEVAIGAQNWLNTSGEDRHEIVVIGASASIPQTNPAIYSNLVDNKHFVAGIIDARGCSVPAEHLKGNGDYGYIWQMAYLPMKNLALLEALKRKFGGSIQTGLCEDRKSTASQLVLSKNDTISLLDFVEGSLMLRAGDWK